MPETETLDKLFLELSQFTKAKTSQQWRLEELLARADIVQRNGNGELAPTVSLLFKTDSDAQAFYELLTDVTAKQQ